MSDVPTDPPGPPRASGAPAVAPEVPHGLRILTAWTWRLLVCGAGAVVVGYVFLRLSIVTVPVFVALLVAAAVAPVTAFLRRHRWPPALAAAGTLGLLVLALAGIGALIVPPVVDRAAELEDTVRTGATDLPDALGGLGIPEADVEKAVDGAGDALRENAGEIGFGVFEAAVVVANLLAGTLLMIVVLFFLLKDGPGLWRALLRVAPRESRDRVDARGRAAFDAMSRYVQGQAIVAFVDAVGIGLAMVLVGVPLALPVAVLTFVLAFIPFVGAIVSGFVATAVALAMGGTTEALIILAACIAVQQLEGDVLYPLIVGRAVALHPVVILCGLGVGASVGGLVGAIVAVPLLAAGAGAMSAETGERAPPSPA